MKVFNTLLALTFLISVSAQAMDVARPWYRRAASSISSLAKYPKTISAAAIAGALVLCNEDVSAAIASLVKNPTEELRVLKAAYDFIPNKHLIALDAAISATVLGMYIGVGIGLKYGLQYGYNWAHSQITKRLAQ